MVNDMVIEDALLGALGGLARGNLLMAIGAFLQQQHLSIVLPGMSHIPQLQDPTVTAEALTRFWARHSLTDR